MLKEKVAEAKEAMRTTFEALERESQVLQTLQEQLSRSHRCWPSRWGWGTVIVLLCYLLFFHSTYQTDMLQRQQVRTWLEAIERRVVLLELPPRSLVKKPWWRRR